VEPKLSKWLEVAIRKQQHAPLLDAPGRDQQVDAPGHRDAAFD